MKTKAPIPRFPFDLYTRIGQTIQEQKKSAAVQKERWQAVRKTLSETEQIRLDNELKKTFEQLQNFFFRIPSETNPQAVLAEVQKLVAAGASAKLLDNYELGNFNVAGAVKHLIDLTTEKDRALAEEIIRVTVPAEPDLVAQKAYAGNGGARSMYWLCEYLAGGLGPGTFQAKDEFQYGIFFRLFCLLVVSAPETLAAENYWLVFQQNLRPSTSPEVASMQKEVFLWLIHSQPQIVDETWNCRTPFYCIPKLIKNGHLDWLPLFYPYPDPRIQNYLDFLQAHLSAENNHRWLNSFKVTKAGRKFFQHYFRPGRHWLLSYIVQHDPDSIVRLVLGQESEMLEPFLKNYKNELLCLQDKKGNSLLHVAVQKSNPSAKLILRLQQLGFSADRKNQAGETCSDILSKKTQKIR